MKSCRAPFSPHVVALFIGGTAGQQPLLTWAQGELLGVRGGSAMLAHWGKILPDTAQVGCESKADPKRRKERNVPMDVWESWSLLLSGLWQNHSKFSFVLFSSERIKYWSSFQLREGCALIYTEVNDFFIWLQIYSALSERRIWPIIFFLNSYGFCTVFLLKTHFTQPSIFTL